MRVLFAHTNYPAQFGAFGEWLAEQGDEVVFLTQREGVRSRRMHVLTCRDHRAPGADTHRYIRGLEKTVITGQAFARLALDLARRGWAPEVMTAHSGWGAGAFLKDVWPAAAFAAYCEWHYAWPHPDRTPWDAPAKDPVDARARNRLRNAPLWLDLSAADAAFCPTEFQAAQFPEPIRRRLTVLHDGIDTDRMSPGEGGRAILARWGVPEDAEVVTSITRGMEPHRGFPETMRAIALLQRRRPRLHALIGGEDRVAYGAKLPEGESWKARMLAELDLDLSRVHFTGLLSRDDMVAAMRASDAHLYLTVPFVLSWSLLDAMAVGCLLVASDTAPVREFVTDGETGLLVPMHDAEALAARVTEALDGAEALRPLRAAARALVVERLDATRVIWPQRRAVLARLAAGKLGEAGEGGV